MEGRRRLPTLFFVTAAFAAAVTLYLTLTVPPAALRFDGQIPATFVSGAYHIHTLRSDGTGTAEDIAKAAARAGLGFLILTDHGDATRPPDPPQYRNGVLCIDAVELSTDGGHVVALGLPAAPYPLAGSARDVVDDVHRLGGKAIIAHPDSPKQDLRWQGQNVAFDGIEWLNADSEWRDEGFWHLFASGLRSFVREPEIVASLFDRPVATLQRWDRAARQRQVFGLAAVDAHARVPWRDDQSVTGATLVERPTYEGMFRAVNQTVVLEAPLSGDAKQDATRVLAAITAGHSFSIVRAYGGPVSLEFTARQGDVTASMGDRVDTVGETTFHARVPQAPGARVALVQDGRVVATGQGSLRHADRTPGVYRVEVTLPGHDVPWLVSNPITVGLPGIAPTSEAPPTTEFIRLPADGGVWDVQTDKVSRGITRIEDASRRFEFRLAPPPAHDQFAALATAVTSELGVERLKFIGRTSRKMRLSVQVRLLKGPLDQRWRTSVYLDETPRPLELRLQDFTATDTRASLRPIVAPLQTILFVVDTVNTPAGAEGTIWISDLALVIKRP